VKVVEGSEVYNFPIHHFVHFYSTFWSYTCSNGGTGKHSASRAATSHAAHLRRAVPRPAPPGAPYRGAHRPEAVCPEAPRPEAPRPEGPLPEWHGCRANGTSCLRRRTPSASLRNGGGGRPPIRSTNSSSHRRALPLRLALAYGRTPCHAIPSRPSAPVEATAASSGFQPAASPTKPSSTSPSPTKGARATPLLCPAATSPE
jgi:hypothetical protein